MKLTELKKLIKECILEEIDLQQINNDSNNHYEDRRYIYDGEFSSDYSLMYKLEKSINRLPRKIGNRSVSALFIPDKGGLNKPFQPKNPVVEIKYQIDSSITKVFMTLKDWNKNGDKFILSKDGVIKKGKKIDIPKELLTTPVTVKEILELTLNWMEDKNNKSEEFI